MAAFAPRSKELGWAGAAAAALLLLPVIGRHSGSAQARQDAGAGATQPSAPQASPASDDSLDARIKKVVARPEFAHASFGIEFYSLDTGKPVYQMNAEKMFTPGSDHQVANGGYCAGVAGFGLPLSHACLSHRHDRQERRIEG